MARKKRIVAMSLSEESFAKRKKEKVFLNLFGKDKESGMGFLSDTTKSARLSVLFQY